MNDTLASEENTSSEIMARPGAQPVSFENYGGRRPSMADVKSQHMAMNVERNLSGTPSPASYPVTIAYMDPALAFNNRNVLQAFSSSLQLNGIRAGQEEMSWVTAVRMDLRADAMKNRQLLKGPATNPAAKTSAIGGLKADKQNFRDLRTGVFVI